MKAFSFPLVSLVVPLVTLACWNKVSAETFISHPPMRPLPQAQKMPLAAGPKFYVDEARGADSNAGNEQKPWKTLSYALRHLKAGDTLYLRAGVFHEKNAVAKSGTAEAPITIASYPGELAVIDGGLPEFLENPATAWEPCPGGVEGEYISTKTYSNGDPRVAPHQFIPDSWEPMLGLEDERPLALGHFADSMLPLHGYRTLTDLRSTNELWIRDRKELAATGIYGGPGLWFDRDAGRIHIRLSHHKLEGLGDAAYKGETDPRKLPLVIALGFGEDVFRITGIQHLRVQNVVFRGATGSPMVHIYGSEDVTLDHVTIFGGFPGLMINASKDIHVTNSAVRSLAAPWLSRAHMKYRGTASYAVILENNQPLNENIELAWSEFTDGHDFAFLRFAKNLQFHHNFVENFNDDGLECGPKLRSHTLYIHENRIGPCLSPMTQHEMDKDEAPVDHDAKSGEFLYRNIFDLRSGTYYGPPQKPDPTGAYLHFEGTLASDHGGPVWPVIHFYQNTVLREGPIPRDLFLIGLAPQALRNTERDVFNNLFVQMGKVPGANFTAMRQVGNLREGGNILWGQKDGPEFKGEIFAKFRASAFFNASKQYYEPGWTMQDRVADPKFVSLPLDGAGAPDLRLQPDSVALKTGQPLPADLPDSFRKADGNAPDIGALPQGVEPWGVGIDGRLSLFTGKERK